MSADYVMVGGFLGAGKTTALLRLAEHLTAEGRRVGLITNDQSQGLVDTSIVNANGYPVEEIVEIIRPFRAAETAFGPPIPSESGDTVSAA